MARSNDPSNATLVARADLDDTTTIFKVRPDTPVDFTAGQWTEMGLPKAEQGEAGPRGEEFFKDGVVRRAYSIASAPGLEELEFIFNRVDEGQLTRWLWELNPGDRLYVDPEARGHFTLDGVKSTSDLVFAATGTGIAPFAGLIRAFAGRRRWRRLVLLHGVRRPQQLGFADFFRETQEHDSSLLYVPIVSQPQPNDPWRGRVGRLPELLRNRDAFTHETGVALDPKRTHVYLCGNSAMIRDVEDLLIPLGFEPRWSDPNGRIHTEIYY
jgi:ferredoxin--NADP+ reductase